MTSASASSKFPFFAGALVGMLTPTWMGLTFSLLIKSTTAIGLSGTFPPMIRVLVYTALSMGIGSVIFSVAFYLIYSNFARVFGQITGQTHAYASGSAEVSMYDHIRSLPEGFETRVGERGTQLSGGQRQRVAIARAMLRDAPLLLLDEATSSLDAESERAVQEALERLMEGRTSIVVAHRLSTVREANRILVLEQGRIAEEGTHADLLARGGRYAELYGMQFV